MMSKVNDTRFERFLLSRQRRINNLLSSHLKVATKGGPKILADAMKYAVLNGGKRLRSIFIYAIGHAYRADIKVLDGIAIAIEMIHSFSLVHDDLPAMDDDNLRRGKPTCHLAFDESTAILVGDALLILAFQVLSEDKRVSAQKKVEMIKILTEASGPRGMAGGQYLDLHMPKKPTKRQLERISLLKTGALISASIKLGALVSGVSGVTSKKLERLAVKIGLAFQIKDDILNIEGSVSRLGKNVGTDKKQKKSTYPVVVGISKAKMKLASLLKESERILQELKLQDSFLSNLINFVIKRDF